MDPDVAGALLTDLIRSAWIVEASRAAVYERWSLADPRWREFAAGTHKRAAIIEEGLGERGRRTDPDLVAGHAAWIRSLVGDAGPDVIFADIFTVRLGDWVEAHAGPFLGGGEARLKELGDVQRNAITFPESMPEPPTFEPLAPIAATAPGSVVFSFGILGDLHIGSERAEAMARAAIRDLNHAGVDLVIQLGDITDHGNRDEFTEAKKLLAELEMPVATMLGNHDVYSYQEERLTGREYYPGSFGREPDGVILEHKGWRFAVLDSAEIGASPFAPFDLVTGRFLEGQGGAVVRGAFTPAQHEILATIAEPDAPPGFVFLHHPPQPFSGFPPVLFGLRDEDSGRLHATCDSGNVWGVFAGHTHRNARTTSLGAVPAQEVAIARDFPYGYAIIDVAPEGYAYRFVQISDMDLLASAYPRASAIHRRYGTGRPDERGFVWTRPGQS